MKSTKTLFSILSILLLIGLSSFKSAEKSELLLPTRLKVTVLDNLGNFVEGASVSIYTSEDNYRNNKEAVATGTTDEKGQIKFKDLNPASYFIDARKGDKNNDAAGVKTAPLQEGKMNKVNTIIE